MKIILPKQTDDVHMKAIEYQCKKNKSNGFKVISTKARPKNIDLERIPIIITFN